MRRGRLMRWTAGLMGAALLASAPVWAAPQQAPPVRVGGDIKEPKKIKHVDPVYPEEAKSAGVQGVVILEVVIGTDGKVKSTKILRSVPLLDNAAADAVKQWVYTPTLLNGEPVELLMTVTVNFTLKTP
jgi:protein TonB